MSSSKRIAPKIAQWIFYASPLLVAPVVLLAEGPQLSAILAGGIIWLSGMAASLMARDKSAAGIEPSRLGRGISRAIPEDARRQLEQLQQLDRHYRDSKIPLAKGLEAVVSNAEELFQRMAEKMDDQTVRLSAVRYTDILSKLNRALGPNYYLDISQNPELWSDPSGRMEAVEKALSATGDELLRNIRQINADQDLATQLSLDSLTALDEKDANSSIMGLGK